MSVHFFALTNAQSIDFSTSEPSFGVEQYQAFIAQHPSTSAYHDPAWLYAVANSYGFTPLIVSYQHNHETVAVMPAVLMKNLKQQALLCSLPYCDMGGILALTPESKQNMLQSLVSYCNEQSWQFEYREASSLLPDDSSANTFEDGTKVRMLYSLLDSPEAQLASFKPKLRSQIKKATKNGVSTEVVPTPTQDHIDTFYTVFAKNMHDLGSPVHNKSWFKAILNAYGQSSFMVLAHANNTCVGGAIVLHTNTHAVIPWASTLREYNKLAPNMGMYWEVISEVIRRGIHHFDFGRSGFNEGTYRFKKQWGAQASELIWQNMVNAQLELETTSEKSSSRALVEKTWQKLPLSFTTSVGPVIRKYISL